VQGAYDGGHVRRRRDPREVRLGVRQVARPALGRDDGQIDIDPELACEEHREFARREAVAHRHRETTYKRGVLRIEHVPLDRSPDRVGAIQDDEGHVGSTGRLHREGHGPDVRVVPRPDVLDVEEQHVQLGEDLGGRLACAAVERVDRHSGRLVDGVGNRHARFGLTADAVLGREERGQLHLGDPIERIGRGLDFEPYRAHQAGLIRDQSDPPAFHELKRVFDEHLCARPNRESPGVSLDRDRVGSTPDQKCERSEKESGL